MNHKTLLLFFFLSLNFYQTNAQNDYLERINGFLIGPENVDIFFDTQSEFYIEKYQLLQENISIEKVDNEEAILELDKKNFNRKKTVEEISLLKKANRLLDLEIALIDRYLDLWSDWEMPNKNSSFLDSYKGENCYQIDGQEFSYFSTDYRLDTLEAGSRIAWYEKVDLVPLDFEFELEKISEASTKWVKKRADRNCLSADPNDCLVWSLIEIPAQYDTIVIQEAVLGCLAGFELEQSGDQCERAVISADKVEVDLQVKLMDILTNREIAVKNYEVVKCY